MVKFPTKFETIYDLNLKFVEKVKFTDQKIMIVRTKAIHFFLCDSPFETF